MLDVLVGALTLRLLAMIHIDTGNTEITITDAMMTSEMRDMIHVEFHEEIHVTITVTVLIRMTMSSQYMIEAAHIRNKGIN